MLYAGGVDHYFVRWASSITDNGWRRLLPKNSSKIFKLHETSFYSVKVIDSMMTDHCYGTEFFSISFGWAEAFLFYILNLFHATLRDVRTFVHMNNVRYYGHQDSQNDPKIDVVVSVIFIFHLKKHLTNWCIRESKRSLQYYSNVLSQNFQRNYFFFRLWFSNISDSLRTAFLQLLMAPCDILFQSIIWQRGALLDFACIHEHFSNIRQW